MAPLNFSLEKKFEKLQAFIQFITFHIFLNDYNRHLKNFFNLHLPAIERKC